jgi:hypothetical protein
MKKPTDALEKEFNDGGVFFLEERSIDQIRKPGEKWLSVAVHIAVMSTQGVTAPEFSYSLLNRRGLSMIASDWHFGRDEDTEQDVLSFVVSMRVPDAIELPEISDDLAMTFTDLCFYAGNEAIPENYDADTFTKLKANYKMTDLGWVLPSRYVDYLIDALGKLNDCALGGNMKEAILYTLP